MDQKLKRSILGYIISPIVGLGIIILLLGCEWIIGAVFDVETMHASFLCTMIGMFIMVGIPGVYIITCLIGIPTFYILVKLKLTKWYIFFFSGLAWGAIIFCLVDIFFLKGFPSPRLICMFFTNDIIFGICFLCYWVIAIK